MAELKIAQFYNNYSKSKEKTYEILRTVDLNYCIPDKLPGKRKIPDWSGYTSLHFVVEAMALDLMNELLEKGADLLKQGRKDGCTPVHVAMNETFHRSKYYKYMSAEEYQNYRNKELQEYCLLKTLLSKQVNMKNISNPKNKYGLSHLHIACIVDHAEAVEFFAKAQEPLDQSICYDPNYDPDDYMEMKQLQGYTPLHCAIKYSSVKATNILLQYGADVHVKNAEGMSCVHQLIKHIMDMTDFITMGKRTLCTPCVEQIERLESIVKLVLKTRATDDIFVDDIGLSALHLSCTLRDKSIVEEFLKRKVDVDMRIKNESKFWPGWTPLHFAACFHIHAMIFLLQNGANMTIENSKGETALDLCTKRFTPAEVQLILSRKSEFKNIVLSDNRTKLSDVLLAMNKYDNFKDFMLNLQDVNLTIPHNSPIWAGYSLLHMSVSLNEKTITCEDTIRFELPEATRADIDRYNCTEEEETLYWKRIILCLIRGCSVSMENSKGQTPIHLAFRMLSETTVVELLKHSEYNVVDENNVSHLHIACAVGDLATVKRYLSRGTNVNSRVKKSFDWHDKNYRRNEATTTVRVNSTPLHVAMMFGHKPLVDYLLKRNADVYAKDSLDLTPIHLSICRGSDWVNDELSRILFKKNSNFRNSVSKAGLSHLHVAAYVNDEEAVKQMLLEGAEVESVVDINVKQPPFLADLAGKTPLQVALVGESGKAIEALLEHGANIHVKDLKGVSLLQHLLHELDYPWTNAMIQRLKSEKYNVEASGITLLHFACGVYDVELAEELLKNGADVNARISAEGEFQGATPLYVLFVPATIIEEDPNTVVNLVKLLLDNGADVTVECCGRTALHCVYQDLLNFEDFYRGEEYEMEFITQIVDLMLASQKSYDVNPTSRGGFSHFHLACVRNNVETVKKFLDHGVDVDRSVNPFATDIGGFTSLHFAMAYESEEVAYLLLERGADVKAIDAYGNEPLQVAIKRKFVNFPLIETMISHGADIHAKNLMGETVLDCLLTYGGLTLKGLEFFFDHGCFINILDIHKGIIGSAMLSVAPNDFQPILARLAQVPEVKIAIQSGFNVIQSIVAVLHEGELTVDNYLSSIEFLMGIGCELDQQDTEGKTALHKAASFGNLEALDALLQLGANVNLIDYAKECPFSDQIVESENILLSIDSRKKNFIKTIAYHILKMDFTGLDVDDSNLTYLAKIEKRILFKRSLKQSCRDELKKAKETEIVQNLTVKDFLSESGAVSRYPRLCPELRDVVDKFFKCSVELRKEFPELAGLLAMQYRKACTRRELLQPAREAIIAICQISFPDLCLDAILRFFTNSDMKIVIALVKDLFD